ncbi:hypothetical protein [uncultured Hymenobacter sp.]|uniref:hypothetical protein n=1 Tax=uncultured Hymenobacter sp. TaxID=170016 RepID=UPI0035C97BB0
MMNLFTRWCSLFFLAISAGCSYDNVEELAPKIPCQTPAIVSYSLSISPLLDRNCRSCHNPTLLTGGVNLEDFAELKRRADTGQLLGVVNHMPGFAQMPKDGAKLSDCDLALLQKWVTAGALNN